MIKILFSGVLLGVVGLVTNTPGFVSAFVVGELTFGNVSVLFISNNYFSCSSNLFRINYFGCSW